jgi:transcription antitermination factor NusG
MTMLTSETPDSSALLDPFADHVVGSWFLLRTRSRQEKIIANEFATRGVLHFLPLMNTVRYYNKRKMMVELPLFPGYVFMRGEQHDAYNADRAGRLAQILPVVNQRRLNEELKNIWFALANNADLAHQPFLRKGVRVEVRCGPLRGLHGVIEDRGKRNRLFLQVETLGRSVSLEVDSDLLDVVD